MTLVVDVDFNTFKLFHTAGVMFFWVETKKFFILIKPFKDMIARTTVEKTTDAENDSFRLRELQVVQARQVLNFVIDGKDLGLPAAKPPTTTGEIDVSKVNEEEISLDDIPRASEIESPKGDIDVQQTE